jgi:cytochrome subunit of sulfide dehydrogenase
MKPGWRSFLAVSARRFRAEVGAESGKLFADSSQQPGGEMVGTQVTKIGVPRGPWRWAGLVLALGATSAWPQAQPPSALQVSVWAASCMACHGPDGKAEGTGLSLFGRSADDLSGKLLGYKSGKLKATMMHQYTKGYSDEELRQIAQYIARLK